MIEAQFSPSRSVAIRREVVATFLKLRNEDPGRGLVESLKRNQPSGTGVSTDLEMHFVLLPMERRFAMDAATFVRRYKTGEILKDPIPSESMMVTFLGLCYVANEFYKGLLNRRPYQTSIQASA